MILYRFARAQAARLHQDIGPDFERVRVRPVVRTQVRDALAGYRAADLISAQRDELQRRIEATLIEELERDNIRVPRVLMRDVRIPVAITQAIRRKTGRRAASRGRRKPLPSRNRRAARGGGG